MKIIENEEEFRSEISKIWSNKNEKSIYDFTRCSHKKVWLHCKKHGDYQLTCVEFSRGTRCKKCRSFANWGMLNIGDDFIIDYWSDKNTINPWDIGKASVKKVWIKCQGVDYHDDYEISPNNFIQGKRCPYCSRNKVHPKDSFAQWCIDNIDKDFINNYWSEKNILDPFEFSVHSGKIIWVNCMNNTKHNEYKTKPDKFINGNRCPICASKITIPNTSLAYNNPKCIKVWSNMNKKTPYDYTEYSHKEVIWNCENNKHDNYTRSISKSVRFDFRCPNCSLERTESVLQEKVRLFLEMLEFSILHEEKCTIVPRNPKTKHILPFDNEIKEQRLIIEVMGNQHYQLLNKSNPWLNGKTPEQYLQYQQLKDRYKRIVAKQQGYDYLAIPYWLDDIHEEWKQLINNELNKTKL